MKQPSTVATRTSVVHSASHTACLELPSLGLCSVSWHGTGSDTATPITKVAAGQTTVYKHCTTSVADAGWHLLVSHVGVLN